MPKSLLIISRQAPWAGPGANEALDIVLAGGAFDLPVALLFMDDGIFQLLANQIAAAIQQKNLKTIQTQVYRARAMLRKLYGKERG